MMMLKAQIILCIMDDFWLWDTLEECKMMGAMYVQAVVDSFLNLLNYNTSNFLVQSIIQVMEKFI
jgi:hypothetical protein